MFVILDTQHPLCWVLRPFSSHCQAMTRVEGRLDEHMTATQSKLVSGGALVHLHLGFCHIRDMACILLGPLPPSSSYFVSSHCEYKGGGKAEQTAKAKDFHLLVRLSHQISCQHTHAIQSLLSAACSFSSIHSSSSVFALIVNTRSGKRLAQQARQPGAPCHCYGRLFNVPSLHTDCRLVQGNPTNRRGGRERA